MTRRVLLPSSCALVLGALVFSTPSPAVAGKTKKIAASALSSHLVVVDGEVLVPVRDLAASTGCELHGDADAKSYEAWPCKPGALLTVDVPALERHAKTGGGTQGYWPQPDPPPLELRMDGKLLTRIVVLQGGDPHVPLVEVARLMGGKVERKGRKARIVVPSTADAPLALGSS